MELVKKNYTKRWSSKTSKQILKEIESYHKYFDKYSGAWSISSKDDFTQADKLLVLKELARERGIL
jgi:hypothetical protein